MRFGGLIAAVVFAAIAAIVVLRMSASSAPAPSATAAPEAKSVNIYVATKPLPVGTTISETDIGIQPWPENLMLDGFVPADGKNSLVGMVTRAPMQQNEPVTNSKIANPNDPNFLAGDLPSGMRVVTIPVNETDGVAGFVFPGDHVDLIYTHDVPKWEFTPGTGATDGAAPQAQKTTVTVTETLLTNVKVLAVDQRSSSAGAIDTHGNLIVPHSASLMVSANDSQRVRLASKTGVLSLVLRALADKATADPLVLTSPGDITQSKDGSGDGRTADTVKILRGAPKTDKESSPVDATTMRGAPAGGTTTLIGPSSAGAVIPTSGAPDIGDRSGAITIPTITTTPAMAAH
jgi:pilus assembly protein CpaB